MSEFQIKALTLPFRTHYSPIGSDFRVFGILWGIIREIVNGVFRVAIGVIVAILSTIAFFGFILWLFTL